MVTGITTDELVDVSQDRESIRPKDNKTICNYLNIIRLSNKPSLMEYWNSCFTELSKFTYVRYFFNAR